MIVNDVLLCAPTRNFLEDTLLEWRVEIRVYFWREVGFAHWKLECLSSTVSGGPAIKALSRCQILHILCIITKLPLLPGFDLNLVNHL